MAEWETQKVKRQRILPIPPSPNDAQWAKTTNKNGIRRTCEYQPCTEEWASNRSEEMRNLHDPENQTGGSREKGVVKGETRNYKHLLCGLSIISRTAETTKFWGPMTENKDADVLIKGIVLLSFMKGLIQWDKDEGGYINWFLAEKQKGKARKVSRMSSLLNQTEILLWNSNTPRWPPTQP